MLYRHDQLELTAASQANEQSEDGISDESGTDSEDKSLLRRRTMRRSRRTLGEQTVRRDSIISFSTIGSMYI